jgi:L,D-transpeptidase ErfK/SrfK
MRRQPPIVRCFVALCFTAAATLVAFEWRNPFPEPIVTPDTVVNISADAVLDIDDGKFTVGPMAFGSPSKKQANPRSGNPSDKPSGKPSAAQTAEEDKGFTQWLRGLSFAAEESSEAKSKAVSTELVLSLKSRLLEVRVPGEMPVLYEVAVGQADWQTPVGEFKVINKLENPAWQHPITKEAIPPGPENPLGTHWIGFWSDGKAQIGFHGTDQEDLIGEAVSHGCVRMRNKDIQRLFQQVDEGTSVKVVP